MRIVNIVTFYVLTCDCVRKCRIFYTEQFNKQQLFETVLFSFIFWFTLYLPIVIILKTVSLSTIQRFVTEPSGVSFAAYYSAGVSLWIVYKIQFTNDQ